MKIVLLGAPGSGKGVQAERMVEKYHLCIIGTGNILREEIKGNTALGKKAKEYMDTGLLVPDGIILRIVKHRLSQPDCKAGFIMDGVPRTIAQAEALGKITKINLVIDLEVDDDLIVKRISSRRFCQNCGTIYNLITTPPKKKDICDKCSGNLIQRNDDNEVSVRKRIVEYHTKTKPLKDFYKKQGILKTINGANPIDVVFEDIKKIIAK